MLWVREPEIQGQKLILLFCTNNLLVPAQSVCRPLDSRLISSNTHINPFDKVQCE